MVYDCLDFRIFLFYFRLEVFFSRLLLKKCKELNVNFDENDLLVEECNNVVL